MKLQELNVNGRQRNVPPIEVTDAFAAKLLSSKVGRKRFRVVKEAKPEPKKDKQDNKSTNK